MVSINILKTSPLTSRPRRMRDGSWKVDSSTHTLVTYTVREGEFGLQCSCEGFYYRLTCKHVTSVLEEMQAAQPREVRAVPTLESFFE